jgi:hypothetical protein
LKSYSENAKRHQHCSQDLFNQTWVVENVYFGFVYFNRYNIIFQMGLYIFRLNVINNIFSTWEGLRKPIFCNYFG